MGAQLVDEVWRSRHPAAGGDVLKFQSAAAVETGFYNFQNVLYVAGTHQNSQNKFQVSVVRYAADGPTLPANHVPDVTVNWPDDPGDGLYEVKAMAVVNGGLETDRVYVLAQVPGLQDKADMLLLAYNGNLDFQWMARYDGAVNDVDVPVAVAANDQYVAVVGSSVGQGTGTDMQLLIYNPSDGQLAVPSSQTRWMTPGFDAPADVAIDGSSVYIFGASSNGLGYTKYLTAGYLANPGPGQPSIQWSTYSGIPDCWHHAADLEVVDGRIYITGTVTPDADFNIPGDYFTVRLDPTSGSHVWPNNQNTPSHGLRFAGPNGHDYAAKVKYMHSSVPDGHFKVYVTGRSRSLNGDFDILTVKYDDTPNLPMPAEVWSARLDTIPLTQEYFGAHDAAIDMKVWYNGQAGQDEIYVTGYRTNQAGNTDFVTVKYRGNSSAVRWGIFYPLSPGTASLNDTPWANTIQFLPDLTGTYMNIFVTGQSYGAVGNSDFLTSRYRDLDLN